MNTQDCPWKSQTVIFFIIMTRKRKAQEDYVTYQAIQLARSRAEIWKNEFQRIHAII